MIASTHRAHGHTLAKGTHPNEVMAELYGKLEGTSHGYGGSMHLYDAATLEHLVGEPGQHHRREDRAAAS